MSYIGNEPRFTQFPSKFFNGDGSSQTVTLDYAPPNKAAILVFIAGVRQDTDAYTLTGTSLTFTGTVPSGTDNVQVVHLGLTVQVPAPADDTITTAKIQDDAVTSAKILDGAIVDADVNASAAIDATKIANGSVTSTEFQYIGGLTSDAQTQIDSKGASTSVIANQDDIALLGFKVAANGSLARYNLVDQSIDAFEDASGVDASASTAEVRNASNYYYGEASVTPSITSNEDSTGTDGDYTWYKWTTVTSSGSYVNDTTQDHEHMIVAGGGGGGGSISGAGSGGGGAGGYRTAAALSLVGGTTYTISVGAGGASTVSGSTDGASGSASSLSGSDITDVTSAGGGGGGAATPTTNADGLDGGSGGGSGGSGSSAAGGTGGDSSPVTSPVQGYRGGNQTGGGGYGVGGGGSSAQGVDGGYPSGSAGGAGTSNDIAGSPVTYATGGTAGTGGTSAAPANTGDGGGGAGQANDGAAGGSGIVVLRRLTGPVLAEGADMTLVSNAQTAEAAPTNGDLVMTISNGAGTTTVNTDIKAYIARDGSDYTVAVTLVDQGDTGGHTILTANGVDLSGETSGTSMRWKITTHNQSASKTTRIQAVSLGWS